MRPISGAARMVVGLIVVVHPRAALVIDTDQQREHRQSQEQAAHVIGHLAAQPPRVG